MTAIDYNHPCGGDKCLNTVCCEDVEVMPTPKINHNWAIKVLERKMVDNRSKAFECERYKDPQHEIDVYYNMNKDLQVTIDFLKGL